MKGFHIGPEITARHDIGWLELDASVAFGYEQLAIPVSGFQPMDCSRGKLGIPCYPDAIDQRFFVELRAAVSAHLRWLDLGAYAGGDAMPTGGGWSAGGFVAVASRRWHEAAQIGQ
jgi:hypothetical protein